MFVGQPERYVELCRAQLTRSGDTNTFARANLVLALAVSGSTDEAMVTANGLIDAAEAIRNPWVLAYTLLAYGYAFRDTDPDGALEALRRGVLIAQDSGNRLYETQSGVHGCPDSRPSMGTGWRRWITSPWPSARTTSRATSACCITPLAILAVLLDRLGRYEPAATIAGFAAVNPMVATAFPELGTAITHLREVLGDQTYESLARKGETMTTAAMATYAYDQIDQARTELNAVSE